METWRALGVCAYESRITMHMDQTPFGLFRTAVGLTGGRSGDRAIRPEKALCSLWKTRPPSVGDFPDEGKPGRNIA